MVSPEKQLQQLRRGVVEIISEPELLQKLARKKPLVIKAGFDPTAPDLHLGHAVLLRKLRQFQDLGHKVIFLIGDATGLVGDPSGQSQTRPVLTRRQIAANAQTYLQQVRRILDVRRHFHVRYNSEWFSPARGKGFDFATFVEITRRYTVARLIERDDFQKRMKAGQEISVLEELYPLMQGYDSVMLKADVELGGTDQKFNLLVGRDLQRRFNQEPQVVMTLPLLIGTDGVNKMSKSLGNHVGITDSPKDIFGKLMSIPDALMESYATLLTDLAWDKVRPLHPKEAKVCIAQAVVTQYHGAQEAQKAAKEFDRIFRSKELPTEMAEVAVATRGRHLTPPQLWDAAQAALVTHLNLRSKSELRRLIDQRGLKINGQTATLETPLEPGGTYTLQAGPRRFLKVALK